MESTGPDAEYRRTERDALVIIVVLAALAVVSLLVAFSYYCYLRNKVSKRHSKQKSEYWFSLFVIAMKIAGNVWSLFLDAVPRQTFELIRMLLHHDQGIPMKFQTPNAKRRLGM